MQNLNETIYFIVNPVAGNKGSMIIWEKAEDILISENVSYEVFFTEAKGQALRWTKEILMQTNQKTRIIAVGGDGTLHEVINGAAAFPHAVIGSIPGGSGNDYVRGVQKTTDLEEALSLFFCDVSKSLDIGQYKTKGHTGYFMNSIGIGIDAEITYEVDRSPLKKWFNFLKAGKLIYLFIFIRKLFTYKPGPMELTIDGKRRRFEKVWFIVIANQPYFGGGMKISPKSKLDDGIFEVLAVHDLSLLKVLTVFLTVLWGGHLNIKNVDSFSGNVISVKDFRAAKVQADGENVGMDEVEVRVLKEKICVMFKGR
ncbi:diacylglycerol/lipid kinase family protein [Peribacillus sp. NPDC097675]|uniref:diacylglycerol/lipid kinase family protein n=1 Tax=Peribacillus sp. NPDC097675 TaxID=3390618 RepID=UPI003D0064E5